MLKFFGAVLGSWVGWWLGSKMGTMTAYFLSLFGTVAGLYMAIRFKQNMLD